MSPLEAQSHAFCRHKLSDPVGIEEGSGLLFIPLIFIVIFGFLLIRSLNTLQGMVNTMDTVKQ